MVPSRRLLATTGSIMNTTSAVSACRAAVSLQIGELACRKDACTDGKKQFHSSSASLIKRKLRLQEGMLPDTRMFPPAAEGSFDDILEARRAIFGIVQGNGQRTGRKVLRAKLSGGTLKSYYEPRLEDFGLEKVGIENPVREELFQAEQEKNRIGKTRIKPKMRGTTAEFARVMKLEEAEEDALEPVDVWAPEDALPDKEVVDYLEEGLDDQQKEWLHELLGRVAASAEDGTAAGGADDVSAEGAEKDKKEMKKANARKFAFRKGLDDKRTRAQGQYGGGDDDEEERSEASAAADGGAPKGAVEPSGDGIVKVDGQDDQDKDAQGLEAGKDGRLTPHQLRTLESLAKPEMWQSPAEASAGGKDVSADVAEIVELLKKHAQQGEKK